MDAEPRDGSPAEIEAYWMSKAAKAEEECEYLERLMMEAVILQDLVLCFAYILKRNPFWLG